MAEQKRGKHEEVKQKDEKAVKTGKSGIEDLKNTIENQQRQLEEKNKQIDELDDRLKRLMAEFENFKKRSSKERESMYSILMSDIIESLLPVLDNLEKACEVKTEDENYKQGVDMVLKQFKEVLKNNGVTEIEAVGKTFNPEFHEAVTSVVDENLGVQEIQSEYRKGYKIGDKVIRHSLVVVAN